MSLRNSRAAGKLSFDSYLDSSASSKVSTSGWKAVWQLILTMDTPVRKGKLLHNVISAEKCPCHFLPLYSWLEGCMK